MHHNKIRGFRFRGIYLGVANLVAGGNLCGDVHVHDNRLYNTGIYGIDVEGYAHATSPEFVGLEILNNQIVDDRGAGSQLQWGVYVNAYTDKTTIAWGNRVIGYTNGDVNFAASPLAQHYWPTWPVLQATQIGFFGAAPVGKQPGGGALTAGAAYTATEQSMLNFCYSALKAYGLI